MVLFYLDEHVPHILKVSWIWLLFLVLGVSKNLSGLLNDLELYLLGVCMIILVTDYLLILELITQLC
jgi:hypothetical protein